MPSHDVPPPKCQAIAERDEDLSLPLGPTAVEHHPTTTCTGRDWFKRSGVMCRSNSGPATPIQQQHQGPARVILGLGAWLLRNTVIRVETFANMAFSPGARLPFSSYSFLDFYLFVIIIINLF